MCTFYPMWAVRFDFLEIKCPNNPDLVPLLTHGLVSQPVHLVLVLVGLPQIYDTGSSAVIMENLPKMFTDDCNGQYLSWGECHGEEPFFPVV